MLLIKGDPLAAPDDATRLVASLWRLATGGSLGLYHLSLAQTGQRDDPYLGVHSRSVAIEEAAAAFIARSLNGEVLSGSFVADMLLGDDEVAARRLYPFARHLRMEAWKVFGQQRVDPLKLLYRNLRGVPEDVSAGVGMVIRPMPGHRVMARTTVFAAGTGADLVVDDVAASYEGLGVRQQLPLRARAAIRECLLGRVGWPWAVERVDEVALLWHQKYEAAA